jgi:hypothetical protein
MQITTSGTEDITQAMGKLANFDAIATKHWKSAMKASVKPIAASAKASVPVDTGKWQRSVGSRVTGKGTSVTGKIGSFMTEWYPNVVEHGAKAHAIGKGGVPAHVLVKGQWKTIVQHPGFAGRFVFKNAVARFRNWIYVQFTLANESISQELTGKSGFNPFE